MASNFCWPGNIRHCVYAVWDLLIIELVTFSEIIEMKILRIYCRQGPEIMTFGFSLKFLKKILKF